MKKKRFIIAVSFTNLSREQAKKTLEKAVGRQNVSENGFWSIVEDEKAEYVLIDGKRVMLNPGFDDGDSRHQYASTLVTRVMDVDSISSLFSVLIKLYDAGAIVTSTDCVKIYFLNKYSKRVARQVMERLVPWNNLLYTSLLFPDVLRPFSIGDFERLKGSYDEDVAFAFDDLRQEVYNCYGRIIEGMISNRGGNSLNRFLIEAFLDHANPVYIHDESSLVQFGPEEAG